MPFKPYNFKLNTENPDEQALITRIEAAENKSQLFKAALYHYFEMPPPPPPEPVAPAPAGGVNVTVKLDAATLAAGFVEAFRILSAKGYDFTVGVPLNQDPPPEEVATNEEPEAGMIMTTGDDGKPVMMPKRLDYDPLAEAMAGLESFAGV